MSNKTRIKQLEKLLSSTAEGKIKTHVLNFLDSADNKSFTSKGVLYKDIKDFCKQNKTTNQDLFLHVKKYDNATH